MIQGKVKGEGSSPTRPTGSANSAHLAIGFATLCTLWPGVALPLMVRRRFAEGLDLSNLIGFIIESPHGTFDPIYVVEASPLKITVVNDD